MKSSMDLWDLNNMKIIFKGDNIEIIWVHQIFVTQKNFFWKHKITLSKTVMYFILDASSKLIYFSLSIIAIRVGSHTQLLLQLINWCCKEIAMHAILQLCGDVCTPLHMCSIDADIAQKKKLEGTLLSSQAE